MQVTMETSRMCEQWTPGALFSFLAAPGTRLVPHTHTCTNMRTHTHTLKSIPTHSALVGALSTKFADKVPEFMAYQALIVKCSRDYDGFGWVLYDRAFRRQVVVTKDLNWSKLNPTLHSLCLAGKAKNNKFCTICLSDNHTTEQCPESWQMFPPMYYPGQVRPLTPYPPPPPFVGLAPFGQGQAPPRPPNHRPVPICKLFNRPEGPRCTFHPYCRFRHVCMVCSGPHARAECGAKNSSDLSHCIATDIHCIASKCQSLLRHYSS